MPKIFLIIAFALLLHACNSDFPSKFNSYEFDFTNKEKTQKITLRFSKPNVNIYSGWKHDRNSSVSVSMWYPSLEDASSPNVWISTKKERDEAKIKPSPEDRKITLNVGRIARGNTLLNPSVTLTGKMDFYCRLDGAHENKKFKEDGKVGNYYRYKYIEGAQPNPRINYLYHPIEKIKGVHCIKCNGATCQLFGITDFGVSYKALESYVEGRMADEAIEIHSGVNNYLTKKIVNN